MVAEVPPSPITESVWNYRRWFIFLSLFFNHASIIAAIYYHADWRAISALAGAEVIIAVMYVIAPSAEQLLSGLTKLAVLRIPGISFGEASAVITQPGGTTRGLAS